MSRKIFDKSSKLVKGTLKYSVPINKNTIKDFDDYDLKEFARAIEVSPKMRKTEAAGYKISPTFPKLHNDLFAALYKYNPELHDAKTMDKAYVINHMVNKVITENKKYIDLRLHTRLDRLTSIMGTETLGQEAITLMKEIADQLQAEKEAFDKAMEDLQKAMEDQKEEEGEGNGDQPGEGDVEVEMSGGKSSDSDDKNNKNGKSANRLTLEQAKAELEKKRKELENSFVEKGFKEKITNILDQTLNKVKETSDMIENWGLGSDPSFSNTGYQEKIKLLDRLNSEKLRQVSALVGRMRRLAMSTEREKIKHGMNDLYNVEIGNNPQHALPSDLKYLATEETEDLFYHKVITRSLLQYQYIEKEKKHKGPIVIAIDESGSMSGISEFWAKAVGLGLLEIAKMQKRDFFAIHFSSGKKESLKTHKFEFKKFGKESYINEIIDFIEYFDNGGTSFEPPLDRCRDCIDDDPDFSKADIVFITDGEAPVGNSWLAKYVEWKKERKVKLYSVLINVGYNSKVSLEEFSDKIIKVSELNTFVQDTTASDLFRDI